MKLNLLTLLAIFFLYVLWQKNPTTALILFALYLFYKYMKRKKSAARILSKKLSKTNSALNRVANELSSLRTIAHNTRSKSDSNEEEVVYEDLGIENVDLQNTTSKIELRS
mgnify:CR=1 FL=1